MKTIKTFFALSLCLAALFLVSQCVAFAEVDNGIVEPVNVYSSDFNGLKNQAGVVKGTFAADNITAYDKDGKGVEADAEAGIEAAPTAFYEVTNYMSYNGANDYYWRYNSNTSSPSKAASNGWGVQFGTDRNMCLTGKFEIKFDFRLSVQERGTSNGRYTQGLTITGAENDNTTYLDYGIKFAYNNWSNKVQGLVNGAYVNLKHPETNADATVDLSRAYQYGNKMWYTMQIIGDITTGDIAYYLSNYEDKLVGVASGKMSGALTSGSMNRIFRMRFGNGTSIQDTDFCIDNVSCVQERFTVADEALTVSHYQHKSKTANVTNNIPAPVVKEDGDNFSASVYIANNTTSEKESPKVILATYNSDDSLNDVTIVSENIAGKTAYTNTNGDFGPTWKEIKASLPKNGATYAKMYVWDSLGKIIPYCDVIPMTAAEN